MTGLCTWTLALAVAVGAYAVSIVDAQAAPTWRVTPKITVSTSYTDNVDLDQAADRSDVVMRVNPGVSIAGQTARTKVNIDYTGSFMSFVDEGREEWRNELRSSLQFEPIRDVLFLDAKASISQPIINEEQAVSFSNANFSRNRRETISVSANPYFKHRLGGLADVVWGYTFRMVTVANPSKGDTVSEVIDDYFNHVGYVRIDSGNRLGRFKWDVDAFYDVTDRQDGGSNGEEIRAKLNLEYRIVRWLGLLGSVGWERIDFDDRDGVVDEVTWNGGLRFNPTRNTDVTIRYGRQSGDEHFSFDANYTRKRLKFFATYKENITTSQRQFANVFEDGTFNEQGDFVNSLGNFIDGDSAVFGFSNEAFHSKRYETGVAYYHRRTRATLKAFRAQRTFETALDRRVREFGGTFTASREFSTRASGNVEFRYRHTDFDIGPSRVDNFYGVRTSFNYRFSQYLNGVLSYTHSRRDSNEVGNKVRDNVATVSLSASF